MFCSKCGNKIKEGHKFCNKCGSVAIPSVTDGNVNVMGIANSNYVSSAGTGLEPLSQDMAMLINGRLIRKQYANKLWLKGCPIIITECVIADRDQEENIALYLQIENMSDKVIEGFFIDVKGFDVLKAEKCDLKEIACIDMRVMPGERGVVTTPVSLPDKMIRKVSIAVRHVVFEDETIWDYDGEDYLKLLDYKLEQIPEEYNYDLNAICQEVTEHKYSLSQYPFFPIDKGDYWVCACGKINLEDECKACKEKKSVIIDNIKLSVLEDKKKERLMLEEQERENIKQKEEEEKQKAIELQKQAEIDAEQARLKAKFEAQNRERMQAQLQEQMAMGTNMVINNIDNAVPTTEEINTEVESVEMPEEVSAIPVQEVEVQEIPVPETLVQEMPVQETPAQEVNVVPSIQPKKTFCTKCGNKLVPGNLFCTSCGSRI